MEIDCGVHKEKIFVINPGVDPAEELDKKSLEKVESLLKVKSPRLITVSRFDKRKNHEKIRIKKSFTNFNIKCKLYF